MAGWLRTYLRKNCAHVFASNSPAQSGRGVALARWSLVQDELSAGRLLRVFPRAAPLPVGHAYSLVGLRESFRRPEIAAFRDWLRLEIAELAAPA